MIFLRMFPVYFFDDGEEGFYFFKTVIVFEEWGFVRLIGLRKGYNGYEKIDQ